MVLTVEGKSSCSLVTKLSVRRWILALSVVCGKDKHRKPQFTDVHVFKVYGITVDVTYISEHGHKSHDCISVTLQACYKTEVNDVRLA